MGTSLPGVGGIMPVEYGSESIEAEQDGCVKNIEMSGHESKHWEEEGLTISCLSQPSGQLNVGQESCSLWCGELSDPPTKNKVTRTTFYGSKQTATIAFEPLSLSLGQSSQYVDADKIYVSEPAKLSFTSGSFENNKNVQMALMQNRQCQNILRELLLQLEQKQKENKKLQKSLQAFINVEKGCKKHLSRLLTNHTSLSIELIMISEPKFGKSDIAQPAENKVSLGPPSNEDVGTFQKLQRECPSAFELRRWSKQETEDLRQGVRRQLQGNFVREFLFTGKRKKNKAKMSDDLLIDVAEKTFTAEEIRKYLPNVDWDHVGTYVVGRSAAECKIRWLNYENSLLNKSSWTKAEDKRLLHIAHQHGLQNWEVIAEKLSTNRTAAQCLTHYQCSLNSYIMKSSWTLEEDEQLRMAVEILGEKNWQAIAANIEGHTNSQCSNRWHKVVHPGRRCGRWNVEEDNRLICAVSLYGSMKWNKISCHVPGRTDVQCRERWCNVLDPTLKRECWSKEEDKQLEEAVEKYGTHHWASISNKLKPRTDNQCWRRWRCLHPELQAGFKKDSHMRRVPLIPNFVGHRKEHPSLGVHDFLSATQDEKGFVLINNLKKANRKATPKRKKGSPGLHDDYSGSYSKLCRQARMEKLRLSRAKGRLKSCAKRESIDGVPLNVPFISSKDPEEDAMFSDTDQAVRFKNTAVNVNEKLGDWKENCSQSNRADFPEGSDEPNFRTFQELHQFLSSSQLVRKRERAATHDRLRQSLRPSKDWVQDGETFTQGTSEATIMSSQKSKRQWKPKSRISSNQKLSHEKIDRIFVDRKMSPPK